MRNEQTWQLAPCKQLQLPLHDPRLNPDRRSTLSAQNAAHSSTTAKKTVKYRRQRLVTATALYSCCYQPNTAEIALQADGFVRNLCMPTHV